MESTRRRTARMASTRRKTRRMERKMERMESTGRRMKRMESTRRMKSTRSTERRTGSTGRRAPGDAEHLRRVVGQHAREAPVARLVVLPQPGLARDQAAQAEERQAGEQLQQAALAARVGPGARGQLAAGVRPRQGLVVQGVQLRVARPLPLLAQGAHAAGQLGDRPRPHLPARHGPAGALRVRPAGSRKPVRPAGSRRCPRRKGVRAGPEVEAEPWRGWGPGGPRGRAGVEAAASGDPRPGKSRTRKRRARGAAARPGSEAPGRVRGPSAAGGGRCGHPDAGVGRPGLRVPHRAAAPGPQPAVEPSEARPRAPQRVRSTLFSALDFSRVPCSPPPGCHWAGCLPVCPGYTADGASTSGPRLARGGGGCDLLQLCADLAVLRAASWPELSRHVCAFTKALAQRPSKLQQDPHSLPFCTAGRWAAGSPVTREGSGLRAVWWRQIRQFNRVSPATVDAVVAAFPSPRLLQQALLACSTEREHLGLLADLEVKAGDGRQPHRVGPTSPATSASS